MARTIEQRVVEFKFNNSDFEKNVSQSMGTLDDLTKKIKDSTSGEAFKELGKAAKDLNFDSVTTSVQKVTESFSVMEEIAIGALRNMGASIQQHLVSTLKKVTMDNVTSGFQRFGEKTQSVATIMAAIADVDYGDVDKLEYVEQTLEKLAWFSDETSYNFTDMTDNISKFTAAGLDLDTSTTAMMGIATWAANAGQNADVASRAMYQLSQAMGSGSIKLQDWKSIEVANMATQEVKQMLLDYGKLMGRVKTDFQGIDYVTYFTEKGDEKRIDVDTGTFRDSLTRSGWLDAEVFTAAMTEYASYAEALYAIIESEKNEGLDLYATDVMKKMGQALKMSEKTGDTLENIMLKEYGINLWIDDGEGNLVSAMENVTEIGIRAMEAGQKARTFEQVMDSIQDAASTKWALAFEKVFGNMEEATELFTYMSETLYNWFAEPLNSLNAFLTAWKEFEGRSFLFGYIDEEGESVNGAFQNIIDAIDGYKEAIAKGLSSVFNPEELGTKALGKRFAEATEKFKDFTETLIPGEETIYKVSSAVETLTRPFKSIGGAIGSAVSSAKSFVSAFSTAIFDGFSFDSTFELDNISKMMKKMNFGDEDVELLNPKKIYTLESPLKTISNTIVNLTTIFSKFFSALKPSEGAVEKLTRIFEGLKHVLHAIFAPLRLVNQGLEKLASPDSTAIEKFASFLAGPLLEAILWLPSKIGSAITAISEFSRQFDIFEKVKNVLSSAANAIKGFFGNISIGPLNSVTNAIANVSGQISTFVKSIPRFDLSETFKSLADGLDRLESWFTNKDWAAIGASFINDVSSAIKSFGESVNGVINKIKDTSAFKAVSSAITEVYKSVSEWANKNIKLDWISNAFNEITKSVKSSFENVKSFFAGFSTMDLASIGAKISSFAETIKSAINSIIEAVKGFFSTENKFDSIVSKIKDIFGFGKSDIDTAVEEIKTDVDTAVEEIQTHISNAWSHLKPRKKKVSGQAGNVELREGEDMFINPDGSPSTFSASGYSWLEVTDHMGGWAKQLANLIQNQEELSIPELDPSGFAIPLQSFKDALVAMFGADSPFSKDFTKSIDPDTSGLQTISEDVTSFTKILNGLKTGLSTFFSSLGEVVGVIAFGGAKGIELFINGINKVFEVASKIKNSESFKTFIDTISGVITHIKEKFKEKINSESVKGILESILNVIEYIIDNFLQIAPKIAGLMAAKGVMSFGTGFKKIGKGILEIGYAVDDFGKAAKRIGSAAKMDAVASLIKSIALLVVALAASLAIIKLIDIKSFQEIEPALTAIAILLGEIFLGLSVVLAAAGSGISAISTAGSIAALTPLLLGISALITALVAAVKNLLEAASNEKIDANLWTEGILPVFVLILEIFAGIATVVGVAKTPKALAGVKGLLAGVSAMMLVIKNLLVVLMEAPVDQMNPAVAAVAGLLLALGNLVAKIAIMAQVKTAQLYAAAAVIAAIGGVVYVVGDIAKSLSGATFDDLVPSFIVIAGAFLGMILVCDAIKNLVMGVTPQQLAAGAAILAAIAAVILSVGEAAVKIINASQSVATTRGGGAGGLMQDPSVVALAGVLLSMIVVAEILQDLAKSNPAGLAAAGAAMLLMAGAVLVCTEVIIALRNMAANDLGSLVISIAAFAAILGVLVLAAKLLDTESATGFAIFAAGVLLFGAAIAVTAKGIETFVNTMIRVGDAISEGKGSISNGIEAMADIIANSVSSIIKAVGAIIIGILGAILESKVQLAETILQVLNTLLDVLIKWLPTILPKIMEVLRQVVSNLFSFLENDLLPMLVSLIQSVLESIGEVLKTVITIVKDIGKEILSAIEELLKLFTETIVRLSVGILQAIETIVTKILDVVENLGVKLLSTIETLVLKLLDVIESIGLRILEVVKSLVSGLLTVINDIGNQVLDVVFGLLNRLVDEIEAFGLNVLESITNLVNALFDLINGIVDRLDETINNILDLIFGTLNRIVDEIDTFCTNVLDTIFGLLNDLVAKILSFADTLKNAALELLQNFVDGIIEATDIVLSGIHDLIVGEDGTGGIVGHIATFGSDLAKAAGNLIAKFVEGLDQGLDSVLTAIKNLIVGEDGKGGLIGKIGDFGKQIGEAAGTLIAKFAEGIANGADTAINAFIGIFDGVKDESGNVIRKGILDKIGDLAESILNAVIRLLNSLAVTIRGGVPELLSAMGNVVDAIIESIPIIGKVYKLGKDFINSLIGGIKGEAQKQTMEMEDAVEVVWETLGVGKKGDSSREVAANAYGKGISEQLMTGLIVGIREHDAAAQEALKLASQGLISEAEEVLGINSPSKVFSDIGSYIMDGLKAGVDGNDGPQKAMASIGNALVQKLKEKYGELEKAGNTSSETVAKGVRDKTPALENSAKALMNSVVSEIGNQKTKLEGAGSGSAKDISVGITNNTKAVETSARALANSAKASFDGVDFNSSGYNVVDGISKGIDDNKWKVEEKARSLGASVKNIVNQQLEIASPSKVMMETGKFVDLGLAKGIDNYASSPLHSAEDMSTMLVLAMTNAMQMASAALENESYTPTISPVIDLTEIQNGMSEMEGLLYGQNGYSLNAAMNSRYNPYENFDGSEKLDPTTGILGSVDGVTTKLDEMIYKLSQLKVYLDSGALVGGIFDQVDVALGKKAIYSGRGVM